MSSPVHVWRFAAWPLVAVGSLLMAATAAIALAVAPPPVPRSSPPPRSAAPSVSLAAQVITDPPRSPSFGASFDFAASPTITIFGAVVDGRGRPVVEVEVEAFHPDDTASASRRFTRTGRDGRYAIPGHRTSTVVVHIDAGAMTYEMRSTGPGPWRRMLDISQPDAVWSDCYYQSSPDPLPVPDDREMARLVALAAATR